MAYALFDVAAFSADVTIDDAAIASRYENNQASYQTAETVDLEYIELALADIAATVELTEEDLRAAYEEERERFETTEERRASHILIEVADGEEDAARATAESVAARVQGGEDFAAVAAEVSADAGTKTQGGDLGWIGRGMLVGPFEDALFAMQVGEISAPVRTEFGFHIIRLDELRAGEVQSFEAVREELAAETRTRQAEDEFYDRANELGEAAFDAYSELATVASSMDLPIKTLMGFPAQRRRGCVHEQRSRRASRVRRRDRRQRSQQRARRARRGSRARAARGCPSCSDHEAARRGARADSRGADARARAATGRGSRGRVA